LSSSLAPPPPDTYTLSLPDALPIFEDLELIGPAPAPIERIRDRWRWHLLLRSTSPSRIGHVTRYFAQRFRPGATGDIRIAIDREDRKSTRLNSSHVKISYAVFCLKK